MEILYCVLIIFGYYVLAVIAACIKVEVDKLRKKR